MFGGVVPGLDEQKIVQLWIMLIQFGSSLSSILLVSTTFGWFLYFKFWGVLLGDSIPCCSDWAEKAFVYAKNWFNFWLPLVAIAMGLMALVDFGKWGCYAAYCSSFVNSGKSQRLTLDLGVLDTVFMFVITFSDMVSPLLDYFFQDGIGFWWKINRPACFFSICDSEPAEYGMTTFNLFLSEAYILKLSEEKFTDLVKIIKKE